MAEGGEIDGIQGSQFDTIAKVHSNTCTTLEMISLFSMQQALTTMSSLDCCLCLRQCMTTSRSMKRLELYEKKYPKIEEDLERSPLTAVWVSCLCGFVQQGQKAEHFL